MLIEFRVKNFLCFKEEAVLSMVASPKLKTNPESTFEHQAFSGYKLLKSCAVYGPNASGKTNLFRALKFMKSFIINSFKELQVGEEIDVIPFLLSLKTSREPSFFEATIIQDDIRFRYGFEVNSKEVLKEWLYYVPNKREVPLFTREKDKYYVSNKFKRRKVVVESTRKNALFLSADAQFNGYFSSRVIECFTSIAVIELNRMDFFGKVSMELLNSQNKKEIVDFLKTADLGIRDIQVTNNEIDLKEVAEKDLNDVALKCLNNQVDFKYSQYSDDNEFIGLKELSNKYESQGSLKLFNIAWYILAALKCGFVIIIDELDSSLHSKITSAIIELFNSYENNNNAQLIFNTHNPFTMANLRKDQIWFTEKDEYGASTLFSLLDFKKLRQDASFIKNYMMGVFGAVPHLGDFTELLEK